MNFIGIMAVQYIDTSVAGALKSVTIAKVLAIILIIVLAVILSIKDKYTFNESNKKN